MSGLPIRNISKQSDRDVTLFFDKYYTKPISLTDNELTTVLGFFESRGFDKTASLAVSTVLVKQAKSDNVDVYTLSQRVLEQLKLSFEIYSLAFECLIHRNAPNFSSDSYLSLSNHHRSKTPKS